jgi:hypothetical protein
MAEPNPKEFLEDLLSPITRTEQRNLLLASTAGYLVGKVGLIPTQISALGITLTPPAQVYVVWIVALTIFYFLLALIVYGIADFYIWRTKLQDYLTHVWSYMENYSEYDQMQDDEFHLSVPNIAWLYRTAIHIAFVRVCFDCGLPILIGISAIWIVLK